MQVLEFFFHFKGGSNNEENINYHYLHYEIKKRIETVVWDGNFSDPRSIPYSIFVKDAINELVGVFIIRSGLLLS